MAESVLNGKRVLAVDDEADVLAVLEEEIGDVCPDTAVDQATTFDKAAELLRANTYDIVILDIMGVRGLDLLKAAVGRSFNVVMLTAHALTPETLKESLDRGARAYLPKEKLADIVPFLEDVLTYGNEPGWRRLFQKLGDFFDRRFEGGWRNKYRLPSYIE